MKPGQMIFKFARAARLVTRAGASTFVVQMQTYGPPLFEPPSLLPHFSFAAFVYQQFAAEIEADIAGIVANSALEMIGRGIEDHDTSRNYCKWSGLLDTFGEEWPTELLDCQSNNAAEKLSQGERAEYMTEYLALLNHAFDTEVTRIRQGGNPPNLEVRFGLIETIGTRTLSRLMYGDDRISSRFAVGTCNAIVDGIKSIAAEEMLKF